MKDRRSNPGYSPYTHQVFMTQLSAEECGVFQEKLFKFPGFYIQRRTIRQYNYNSAAHVLGDIAEVSTGDGYNQLVRFAYFIQLRIRVEVVERLRKETCHIDGVG